MKTCEAGYNALTFMQRILLLPVISCFLLCSRAVPTRAASIEYPMAGNIRPAQGTVEMWFRLDIEPEKSARFPLVTLNWPGRHLPQINFAYSSYWLPEELHFYLRMDGYLEGRPAEGGMFTSVETTWKGQKTQADYPRHERLHAGEWHYAAFTWRGAKLPETAVYLDGKQVVPFSRNMVEPWVDLESGVIRLNESRVSWDELKISNRVLTPEEVAASFARGALVQDESTLLLDHFDKIENDQTTATQIAGYKAERGGKMSGQNSVKLVEGKFGSALRLIN